MQLDLAHQLEQVNKEMDEMLMVDLQVWSVVYSSLFPDVDFTKAFFFFFFCLFHWLYYVNRIKIQVTGNCCYSGLVSVLFSNHNNVTFCKDICGILSCLFNSFFQHANIVHGYSTRKPGSPFFPLPGAREQLTESFSRSTGREKERSWERGSQC